MQAFKGNEPMFMMLQQVDLGIMSIWPLSARSRRSVQFSSEPKQTAHLPFSILISCSASWLIFSPVSCRGIMLIRSICIFSPCHRLLLTFLFVFTKSFRFKIIFIRLSFLLLLTILYINIREVQHIFCIFQIYEKIASNMKRFLLFCL